MPDLSLHDRLQPALLDRLLDDERTVVLVRVTVERGALERLKLPLPEFIEILRAQGLTLERREAAARGYRVAFHGFTSSCQSGATSRAGRPSSGRPSWRYITVIRYARIRSCTQ